MFRISGALSNEKCEKRECYSAENSKQIIIGKKCESNMVYNHENTGDYLKSAARKKTDFVIFGWHLFLYRFLPASVAHCNVRIISADKNLAAFGNGITVGVDSCVYDRLITA